MDAPVTESANSTGHRLLRSATRAANSSSVSRSSKAEAVTRCAGEVVRVELGDVGQSGLDGDRGPAAAERGRLHASASRSASRS